MIHGDNPFSPQPRQVPPDGLLGNAKVPCQAWQGQQGFVCDALHQGRSRRLTQQNKNHGFAVRGCFRKMPQATPAAAGMEGAGCLQCPDVMLDGGAADADELSQFLPRGPRVLLDGFDEAVPRGGPVGGVW